MDTAFDLGNGSVKEGFVRKPGLYALLDRVSAAVFFALALALFVEVFL